MKELAFTIRKEDACVTFLCCILVFPKFANKYCYTYFHVSLKIRSIPKIGPSMVEHVAWMPVPPLEAEEVGLRTWGTKKKTSSKISPVPILGPKTKYDPVLFLGKHRVLFFFQLTWHNIVSYVCFIQSMYCGLQLAWFNPVQKTTGQCLITISTV